MLEINALSRSFNGRVALHITSLSLRDGEYVAIVGESGVGKSTLLNLIGGLDRAEAVSGHAWLDHEWSSELLPDGAQRRDCVGINLSDASALKAFRLRDSSGNKQWAAASLRSTGKIDQIFTPQAVNFSPQHFWRSPRTGIDYPVAWRLQISEREFELIPLLDDLELDSRRSVGTVYWEGAVRVSENGRSAGEGYLELAGYGERIRVG